MSIQDIIRRRYLDPDCYYSRRWSKAGLITEWSSLLRKYGVGGVSVESGSTRICLIHELFVYKIPLYPEHVTCNDNEIKVALHKPFPCAKCEIVDRVKGIPVLKMERVSVPADFDPYEAPYIVQHPWLDLVGDGRQVGYNIAGELVAYDFAHIVHATYAKNYISPVQHVS